MKASELIKRLQDDLETFGDYEVVFNCDDLEEFDNEYIGIGTTGVYSYPEKDDYKILLVCSECHYTACIEKHREY